jgi:primosomal protein N' (replication factor Y)
MPRYVEVSINISQISDTYHYHVPEDLESLIQPGCLVVVPFGKKLVQGVVLDFIKTPEVKKTLPLDSIVDSEAILTKQQIALARKISQETLAPLGACIRLMIPPGLSLHADVLVQATANKETSYQELSSLQQRLLNLLNKKGPMKGRQLDNVFKQSNWRASVTSLCRSGFVSTNFVLSPARVSPKIVRTAQLAISPEKISQIKENLSNRLEVRERRYRVLNLLSSEALPVDFSWIYAQTGANYSDLKKLVEDGYILFNETEIWRDPLEEIEPLASDPPDLTKDQLLIWHEIQANLEKISERQKSNPILLHGVTGSGKTEIYMRAIDWIVKRGSQAIVLVPEIALTPQIVRRFLSRFPNQVGIYHSKLSEGERYDTWRRARLGDLRIIIGARSALFMPFPDLRLIVLDECDNESYDQTETIPYYHGVATAESYAEINNATLLLGSATPRVTQYHRAEMGKYQLLSLPKRIFAHREKDRSDKSKSKLPALQKKVSHSELFSLPLPSVSVVDMREELRSGNRSPLSVILQKRLKQTLEAGEQAILFLNRKGTATYVFCRECGFVLKCPRDDRILTWHGSRSKLICHTCGYSRNMPEVCPQCGGRQIRQLGMGTEKLEKLIQETIPGARILRWDADTTHYKGAHDLILSHFTAHRADILIGTQMLAKGLDLPLVTFVGVVLAEVGLTLPDYRASERTFQLLTQVAGRAGRSALGGDVIFQTYMPEHYAIQTAATHDFKAFYHQELTWRKKLGYPPFAELIKLEYRHWDNQRAEFICKELSHKIQIDIQQYGTKSVDIIGPVPCFYKRIAGKYRWQIILRGHNLIELVNGQNLKDWVVEVDPPNLL